MQKKILVTGANGFVGRALCRQLVQEGLSVRGTVRSESSFQNLRDDIDVSIFNLSGFNTDESPLFEGIDTVVHLAARVHMLKDKVKDPLAEFRRINVLGTERLAKKAAAYGVKRFIFMSSVKVNGEGQDRPYTEADRPSPQDFYGISKWEAEKKLYSIADKTGLEVFILRPPLVYGPGVKANFLELIKLIDRGIPLPLARVRNHRSFIYLGNLVDALLVCIVHPKASGETFVLSDGNDISTPELIHKVSTALGKPSRLFPCPPDFFRLLGRVTGRSKEVSRLLGSLIVDSTKIRVKLGWKPPYSVEEGLMETVRWYQQALLDGKISSQSHWIK